MTAPFAFPTPAPEATARELFYDYLTLRSRERLSFSALAGAAATVVSELGGQATDTAPVPPPNGASQPTSTDAFYRLADPLLRQGVLGFRGSGTYGLTATLAVRDAVSPVVVFNAPYGETLFEAEALSPGIVRVPAASVPRDIPAAGFDGLAQLRGMPTLARLVTESDDWQLHDRGTPRESWQVLRQRNRWEPQGRNAQRAPVELYRGNDHAAAPYYLWIGAEGYYVPGRKHNPNALSLARLLRDAAAAGGPSLFTLTARGLTVHSRQFPFELERALWLTELLVNGLTVNTYARDRTYALFPEALGELARILATPAA